jgi:hypothetical protein
MMPMRPEHAQRRRSRWLVVAAWVGILCLTVGLLLSFGMDVRDGEVWVPAANNLKLVGSAVVNYAEVYRHLPPAAQLGKEGRPLLSWRVLLLPFLEYENIYFKFKLDEPWDSLTNKPLLENMPSVYARSPFQRVDPPGMTHFRVFVGPGTAFEGGKLRWSAFPDGPANTITVVEATEAVPWTKPDDLVFNPAEPLPPLGTGLTMSSKLFGYRYGPKAGFLAAFGDGSVRFINSSVNDATLRALITRNGGEAVDLSKLD